MGNSRSRVVWREGMTLDPHHFQQLERNAAHALNTRVQSVVSNDWGFTTLEVDTDQLANGEFALRSCSGVFPGGLIFRMPEDDVLPPARSIADSFPPNLQRLGVLLCVPVARSGGRNFELEGFDSASLVRYGTDVVNVPDENTGTDERPVHVARANFQIRFDTDPLDGFTTMPVASVVRGAGGFFALDEMFIPPSLAIEASVRLKRIATQTLEMAVAKSHSFADRSLAATSQRQMTPSDIVALTLLTTINGHIPLLNHCYSDPRAHPEDLYRVMLSLAGGLSALVAERSVHPREFPVYDHSMPTACFNGVAEILAQMLGGARPGTNFREFGLNAKSANLFEAELDVDDLKGKQLLISVKSPEIPESRLVTELPIKIRVASPAVIHDVLRTATRALPIQATNRLPIGIPEDPLSSYFVVGQTGDFWDGVKDAGAISIYVPTEYQGIEIRLMAA